MFNEPGDTDVCNPASLRDRRWTRCSWVFTEALGLERFPTSLSPGVSLSLFDGFQVLVGLSPAEVWRCLGKRGGLKRYSLQGKLSASGPTLPSRARAVGAGCRRHAAGCRCPGSRRAGGARQWDERQNLGVGRKVLPAPSRVKRRGKGALLPRCSSLPRLRRLGAGRCGAERQQSDPGTALELSSCAAVKGPR